MLTPSSCSRFFSTLQRLRIAPDYPVLLLLYKILKAICLTCPDLTPAKICDFIMSKPFQFSLAKYHPALLGGAFSNLQQLSEIIDLCTVFRDNSFDVNPVDFFLGLAPGMVANWFELKTLKLSEDQLINLLFSIHTTTSSIIGTPAVFEADSSILDPYIPSSFPNLSSEDLDVIWNAVCYSSFKVNNVQSHILRQAIIAYAKVGKAKESLLADYLLEFQDINQTPICFNNLKQNDRNKIPSRKTPAEEVLNYYNAAKYLTKELPSKVLCELLYKDQHDPAIECTILANRFLARLKNAKSPLLINPSPQLLNLIATQLLKVNEIQDTNGHKTKKDSAKDVNKDKDNKNNIEHEIDLSIVVPNRSIALALSKEFPAMSFYSVAEAIDEPVCSNLIMVCCPKASKKMPAIETLLSCFTISENCECVIYVPEHLLLGKNAYLHSELAKKNLQISQIIEAPQGMISTKSKKKLMLIAGVVPESETNNNIIIPIYTCETTAGNDYVLIRPEAMYIPIFDLLCKTTVKQALSELTSPPVSKRNKAAALSWSTEIKIAYTTFDGSTEKSNYLRAKAYIIKMDRIDSTKGGHAIPGTQTEQGLRAKSEAELIEKLMELPLREKLKQPIVDEIVRIYGHQPEVLTIKTVWICLRKELFHKDYEDDLAKELFCGPDQSVSNLRFSASYEEFEIAFHTVLDVDHIPIKYWTVLRQIAELGIKYGFLQQNPLDKYAPIVEAENRQKVYSIQDSLRQWCFSPAELDRMINPLILPDPSSLEALPAYILNSQTLLKLFATHSSATKAELIALDHIDMIDLPNGAILAQITKYANSKNQIVEYNSSTKERRKRRKVVFPPFIAMAYRNRILWLEEKSKIKDVRSRPLPIFLQQEPRKYTMSSMRRCSLTTASKLYNELVLSADIPEHQITLLEGEKAKVLDLGLPRKTENVFRNHIMIIGSRYGLSNGELSYAAGVTPEATIDAHYIGFDAPINLIATSGKMHRMSSRYCGKIQQRKSVATRRVQRISTRRHRLKLEIGMDKRMLAVLEIRPTIPSPTVTYKLTLRSNYGHKTTATSISEEITND